MATARQTETQDPWTALPAELTTLLRTESRSFARHIMAEIPRQIPEYARPLDLQYVRTIQRAIDDAVGQFVERLGSPHPPTGPHAETHRWVGADEHRRGRGLESVQAAYRLSARLAWRRVSALGERLRLPRETMFRLGETVFAHVDELAALAVEGYTDAQLSGAGAVARQRRRLLDLLITQPPRPRSLIDEAATAARWTLPSTVTALALEGTEQRADAAELDRLDALVDLESEHPHALLPGQVHDVGPMALAGWRVAIGPPVAPQNAGHSLRWARRVLELIRANALPEQAVTRCEDHLSDLLMLADEQLASEIVKQRLAPLEELRGKQRARLAETLLAWLQTRRGAPDVARRLGVHPQTVRYRLHQLENLFGASLNDPGARFEMELALRARALLPSSEALHQRTTEKATAP